MLKRWWDSESGQGEYPTNLRQISELDAQRHLGLTILAAKDNGEAFRMLESDRADAFVMGLTVKY